MKYLLRLVMVLTLVSAASYAFAVHNSHYRAQGYSPYHQRYNYGYNCYPRSYSSPRYSAPYRIGGRPVYLDDYRPHYQHYYNHLHHNIYHH